MNINTDQYVIASISVVNGLGQPVAPSEPPVWESSDVTAITVTPAEDGMSARVDTVAPGTARVGVTTNAGIGPDGEEVVLTCVSEDLVVVLGPKSFPSASTLTFGAPIEK